MIACIRCGAKADAVVIAVDVDTGEIHCGECEADYTVADVRAVIAAWGPILAWIEAHPKHGKPAAVKATA